MNTEEILATASEIARSWDWATEVSQPAPDRLDVRLKELKELIPMIVALRVKRLGYLSAITGLDLGEETNELEVLYHFCPGNAVITLRVRTARKGGKVPSLSDIIPSAESYERELREMFGIEVVGLRAPHPLYLPEDWPDGVYPLRKDFDPSMLSTPKQRK